LKIKRQRRYFGATAYRRNRYWVVLQVREGDFGAEVAVADCGIQRRGAGVERALAMSNMTPSA
jgi:hypothetical protein